MKSAHSSDKNLMLQIIAPIDAIDIIVTINTINTMDAIKERGELSAHPRQSI